MMPNLSQTDWSPRRQERTKLVGLWVALGVFFAGQGVFHGLVLLTIFARLQVDLISDATGFLMIGTSMVLFLAAPFGGVAASRAYRGERAITTMVTASVLFLVGHVTNVVWRWLNVLDAAGSAALAEAMTVPVLRLLFAGAVLGFLVRTRSRMPSRGPPAALSTEVNAGA